MRFSILLLVLAVASPVHADPAEPLRIAVECESYGRTKACPEFLRGFIAKTPLLLASPRANAQVVLYVATSAIAQQDRIHLRFVGNLAGAPSTVEVDVELDSRGTDDEQIAQLEPAFLRGVALYVAALHPTAVSVTLTAPADDAIGKPSTTPWGINLTASGFGSWTGRYKSLHSYASTGVSRLEPTSALAVSGGGNLGLVRSPAPDVDGNEVSLDTTSWSLFGSAFVERHLTGRVATAIRSSVWRDDPKGQYRYGWDADIGIEYDRFASDDPRGNVLAVAYFAGYQVDGYNFPNQLGERFAHYPTHKIAAAGRIRRDKISYGLTLAVEGEILHPGRRHSISGSPSIVAKLGAHVDLSLSLSLTKRELPEPMIPGDDFEAISRGDYAEPFSAFGSMTISVHWDRTNGAQNNRFQEL